MSSAVRNPFLMTRQQMARQADWMKEAILDGHAHWPKPPPATVPASPAMSNDNVPMEDVSHPVTSTSSIAAPSASSPSSCSSSPLDLTLRAPCFYALYPELWRRREHREEDRRIQETGRGDHAKSESAPSAATFSAPLRLRARSPSRLVSSGVLGYSSTRLAHSRAFQEAIIELTPHVTGHLGGMAGMPGAMDPPMNGSDTVAAQQQAQAQLQQQGGGGNAMSLAPSASVYRRRSRFHKPISDMGDYLSLLRSSIYLRNPHVGLDLFLDDREWTSETARRWLGREKERREKDEEASVAATGSGAAAASPGRSSPASSGARISAPNSPTHRLTVDEADDLPPLSPLSPSLVSHSHPPLTVDEADVMDTMMVDVEDSMTVGGAATAAQEPRRNASPAPLRRARSRSTSPSSTSSSSSSSSSSSGGLLLHFRPRSGSSSLGVRGRPSLSEFVAMRDWTGKVEQAMKEAEARGEDPDAAAEAMMDSMPSPTCPTSPMSAGVYGGGRGKHAHAMNHAVPISAAAMNSSAAAAAASAREKKSLAKLTSLNERIQEEQKGGGGGGAGSSSSPSAAGAAGMNHLKNHHAKGKDSTPSIQSLLATMIPRRPSTSHSSSSAVGKDRSNRTPGVRMLLYRLQCELGAPPTSAAALSVYLKTVESWFIRQVEEVGRTYGFPARTATASSVGGGASELDMYRSGLLTFKTAVRQMIGGGAELDLTWERVLKEARKGEAN
jgi:hypothetical protein